MIDLLDLLNKTFTNEELAEIEAEDAAREAADAENAAQIEASIEAKIKANILADDDFDYGVAELAKFNRLGARLGY